MTRDSLTRLIATEACADLSKQDLSNATKDQVTTQLGISLISLMVKYEDDVKRLYDIKDFSEESAIQNVGKDVGMKLVFLCPDFAKVMMAGDDDESGNAKPAKNVKKLQGTLVRIIPGEFTCLEIKTPSGKLEKIWWIDYFTGAEILMQTPSKLLGKRVSVEFQEQDRYSHTQKEYVPIKVAAQIQLD
jgi:hypothetical protein